MVRVREEPLRRLSVAVFEAAGASAEDAETVSDVLVAASVKGVDSHGVRAIPGYVESIRKGVLRPRAEVSVLRETETMAMLDDGGGFGFVAGRRAMEMAIGKARRFKMGSVGVKGPGHIGALFYYSLMAVREDMIGITLCRGGGHSAVPYGAVEGRLGINPLAVGFPTGVERPVLLDMATTGVAMGHLDVMAVRGEKAPEGWLVKKDGSWSTDPASHRTGEASPTCFGYPYSEYKGYGLSVMVEAWAGAIGAGCSLDEKGFGHVFTAIDPTGYCPIGEFKARMDAMVRHMKSAAKRPGFGEVLLPGEREWVEEERRRREGVFVDDPWWESILKTAKSLGVDAERVMKG